MSAHRLMVEIGRRSKIKLEDRTCPKCPLLEVENELHFICSCPYYKDMRDKLMQTIIIKSPLYHNLSLDDQFTWLMGNNDNDIILALAEYVYQAMEFRNPHS